MCLQRCRDPDVQSIGRATSHRTGCTGLVIRMNEHYSIRMFWKKKPPASPLEAARKYPDRLPPGRKRYLYSKPFGEDLKGDDLPGKFSDFSFILQQIDLKPGSCILDVGCGPGWMSEFLSRMGFAVTGIDASPGMISIARKRLRHTGFHFKRARPDCRFEVMDAHDMPFHECFDAAVVYDTLHHFEFESAVLNNVYKALRPGGKLFLKEPPESHPQSQSARQEMETFGIIEKGYSRDRIEAMLAAAGFQSIRFYYKTGFGVPESRVSGPYLEAVTRAGHREHYIWAFKPPVTIDSRFPGKLSARYDWNRPVPASSRPGEILEIDLTVTNTGDTIWLHEPRLEGGHIRLAVVLEKEDGSELNSAWGQAYLPRDVSPGGSCRLTCRVETPRNPGRYLIRCELLSELLQWFGHAATLPLQVGLQE